MQRFFVKSRWDAANSHPFVLQIQIYGDIKQHNSVHADKSKHIH